MRSSDIVRSDGSSWFAGEGAREGGGLRLEVREGAGPGRVGLGFRTAQKAGSNLYRARAEKQRRGDAATVGNPSGGDDRNLHVVSESRQQREQADRPPLRLRGIETAAVATCLEALRDDRIRTGCLRRQRLGQCGGAGEPGDPERFELADERRGKESHDR